MKIFPRVGDKMMPTMMSRPPQRTPLVRSRSHKRDQELKDPAGLVRTVRQQAMKAGGDRKHANNIQSQARDYRDCADARPNDEQTGQMYEEKLYADGKM
jgi:hypothetical protein